MNNYIHCHNFCQLALVIFAALPGGIVSRYKSLITYIENGYIRGLYAAGPISCQPGAKHHGEELAAHSLTEMMHTLD